MTTTSDRKSSYKLPSTVIRERFITQEARRSKALEDQKRRRAQRIDSSRQLDLFANLNLNDDSEDDDIAEEDAANVPPSGAIGPYVAMLKENDQSSETTSTYPQSNAATLAPTVDVTLEIEPEPSQEHRRKRKKKKRNTNYSKPSKWADQCMYAELLELGEGERLLEGGEEDDCLPKDLETGWVAVAPVPMGKRCLLVTHQSSGVGGVVPNTTLRSRLLGKTLIPRFPSLLPALTVLDCILDVHWRDNGIIHVLDVIRWKGQDVGDCDAAFRFWWRDTRLKEIPQILPPSIKFHLSKPRPGQLCDEGRPSRYQFPYPTYLVPIPYHANTSLISLDSQIIPAARSVRSITVDIPCPIQSHNEESEHGDQYNMEVEAPSKPSSTFTFGPSVTISPASTAIRSDGLLLYVLEAAYEPGTGPLSSWVPIEDVETGDMVTEDYDHVQGSYLRGPLDLFHRLVKRRLERAQYKSLGQGSGTGAAMDL
ncbi:hypothetical protein FA15DRAFT_658917 [Coprinopsis marcescibilis]|uniref:Snurportin-1 n=1 Tax=Coprinopsis marcescibilis TaxID=230819 RepID=A0A5C3KL14_COPMA|nr:hypothetical protein FA15DRAFT_658917 [Coprinopsis marcescibilis]